MKIGIVSQWYPPEPGGYIQADLAADLVSRGHRVRVLTGFPNYPGGKIYPGYRQRWFERDNKRGVTVRRVPLYPSHDSSPFRRAATYLSFATTSTVAAARYLAGADVLYVYHPPATAFAAAAVLRMVHRVPVVLHVQDLWPEFVTASALAPDGRAGHVLHHGLALAMRRIYAASAAVVVIAPSMRELVVERGASPEKVHTVLNWADESVLRPLPVTEEARRIVGHRGRCTVMYAGNLGQFKNIPEAVRAAAAAADCVDLVLVGSGVDEGQARRVAEQLGAENVRFLGRYPASEMAALYAAADFQLVALRDLPIFRGTISSKLQAALCCGSPVLAWAPGDTARLVEREGLGIACQPDDWQALAAGLRRAAGTSLEARSDMGRRARLTYERGMSRQASLDQIEKLLVAAAERSPVR